MSFLGMAPDQVREQAERCTDASSQLVELQGRLDGIVRGAGWQGPDREEFLQQWHDGPSSALRRVGEMLGEDSTRLHDEADEQDRASSADGVGPGRGDQGGGEQSGGELEPGPGSSLFDRARDWVEDRAEDVGDWIQERKEAVEEWLDEGVDGILDALLDDRPWAEIAADKIVDGLVEDGSLHDRSEVEVHGSREIVGGDSPEDLADLVLDNDETRRTIEGSEPPREYDPQKEAQVRIQQVTGADGEERYLVHVPPTQGAPLLQKKEILGMEVPDVARTLEGWDSQGQPFGWDNNLYSMAGRDNAGAEAVKAAMEEAGIPPGSEIAMVAHSQGGLVASQLAADPGFNGEAYQVTDVFSVGSPVQTYTPSESGTDVLNVQHVKEDGRKGDVVPTLDLEGSSARHPGGNPAPNVRDVTFGTPEASEGFPPPDADHRAHDSVLWNEDMTAPDPDSAYYGTVRNHADDPALTAKDERMQGKYYGDGTSSGRDVVVDVSRRER